MTASESGIGHGVRDEPMETNELEAVMRPELQEHLGRSIFVAYGRSKLFASNQTPRNCHKQLDYSCF